MKPETGRRPWYLPHLSAVVAAFAVLLVLHIHVAQSGSSSATARSSTRLSLGPMTIPYVWDLVLSPLVFAGVVAAWEAVYRPLRRRFFPNGVQFSLASMLVLVVTLNALVLLNLYGVNISPAPDLSKLPANAEITEWSEVGFPLRVHLQVSGTIPPSKPGEPPGSFGRAESGGVNILIDLFVFLAGTAGSFAACEWFVRRRARGREAVNAELS